jgi:NAD-dependent dihydropyrimidine dehydrogenase PreA subunit
MPPVIDRDKCNACRVCDWHCPLDVFYIKKMMRSRSDTPKGAGTAGIAGRTARRRR